MKRSLYMNFLICYLVIGIISFFAITGGGSLLITRSLEHDLSEALYKEARNISANSTVTNNISSSNLGVICENLTAISTFQNVDIWIINNKNEVIANTNSSSFSTKPFTLYNFDPTTWGGNYYQTGDFYGHFKADRLSVIAPITSNMITKGYIALHYQMKTLYQTRSELLGIIQTLFLFMYALVFLLVLLFKYRVHNPLKAVLHAISEYANGNLACRIPVKTSDEMGFLSNSLNYLADRMNKNGEYQRKFISNVSHDFRSPLTSIKGYVEAMLDGTIPPELQNKYLSIISYEAGRLEKLTRSLLMLNELDVKKRMMHMRRFDINHVIKTTAESFEGICTERKIHLELFLSGRELFVRADMEQIQQVLYNLLDNAIKFSNDNSYIRLETTEKNEKVFVSVKDSGCGIPKESLSRIWERFYKSDASRGKDRKGTGLGLSIVKEIINAHEENINVVSTEGVGTEFIFTLAK